MIVLYTRDVYDLCFGGDVAFTTLGQLPTACIKPSISSAEFMQAEHVLDNRNSAGLWRPQQDISIASPVSLSLLFLPSLLPKKCNI